MVKRKEILIAFVSLIFLTLFCVSLASATLYVFNGTIMDPNGNVLNGTLINLTMTDFGNGMENDLFYYNHTYSDENGRFSINYTSNSSWMYSPVIRYTNITTGAVQYVGQTIPGFPVSEFSMIQNVNFYLTEAGAINVTAINSSGGRRYFNYMIMDSKLGSEVAYGWSQNGTSEIVTYVPKNRNYSITIFPLQGMPINYGWTNFSANISYNFSDGLSSYNYTTKTIHKQINTTETFGRVTGYINYSGIYGWQEFSIVAFTVQPGNRVSISHCMPYNISSWTGGTDIYNLTTGFYNITLPILAEGGTALLMAVAKNSSYYAGYRNISLASGRDTQTNFTLYGMLGENANYSMNQGQKNISLKLQSFTLVNSTNSTISSMDGFFEMDLDYSNYGAMSIRFEKDIDSSEAPALSFPMLNVTGLQEINVYTQNYAPKRLSQRTASQIISNSNISLSSFNPGDIDGSDIADRISIALYKSNSSCDSPIPGAGCELASTTGVSNFNPLSVVIGGGALSFRMGLVSSGIVVHYVNVDLLASGPPDALFDDSATTSTSGSFDSAMRFGGNGPTIYDYVLISMPYTEGSTSQTGLNESADVNMSIPILYDENWNIVWNASINGTTGSALAGNNSHYSTYSAQWGTLMGQNNCTKNQSMLNATNPCYIDTTNNRIWVRLPHFSGIQPSVTGRVITATTTSSSSSSSGGGSLTTNDWIITYAPSINDLANGYFINLFNNGRVKISLLNETHYVGIVEMNTTAKTIKINVSSETQQAVLAIGDERKFEVTGDNYYDILVKLNNVTSTKADLLIKTISELMPVLSSSSNNAASGQETTEDKGASNNLIWWLGGIMIILVLAYLIVIGNKKAKWNKIVHGIKVIDK
ncbi:hypothetical protein FJZ17_02365 [Candidatus Pacearchaeota archaeon]|nr:hypothetical protein [Candidatus Pacearchaeota archaeon]